MHFIKLFKPRFNDNSMRETVLVTGSGNGLGEAIARVFAKNTYNIILHARKESDIKRVRDNILDLRVDCDCVLGDLRNESTLEEINDIARRRDISILVNNAATRCLGIPLESVPVDNLYDLIYVNLLIPIKLTQMVYPYFQGKRNGAFININSITALEPKKFRGVSTAAKSGLDGFANAFRQEAIEYNVRVLGIYPTRIKTKPEFEYGIDPDLAAQSIFDAYKDPLIENIILEGRPQQFRSNDIRHYTLLDLRE